MNPPTRRRLYARCFLPLTVLVLACLGAGLTVKAEEMLFNFENVSVGESRSILTLTQSRLTLTIALPGSSFADLNPQPSASDFGSHSLLAPNSQTGAFVVSFSSRLSSFSLGDGERDEDRRFLEAVSSIPERATLLLMGVGLLGLSIVIRRRRSGRQ